MDLRSAAHSVAKFVASPPFTWAAVLVAVVTYAAIPRDPASPQPSIVPGLGFAESVAFIVAGTGYIISSAFYLAFKLSELLRPSEIIYLGVRFFWNFLEDGTFSGVYSYHLQNRSAHPVAVLPKEAMLWFQEPKDKDIRFRLILRDSKIPHAFEDEAHEFVENEGAVLGLKFSRDHTLSWAPRLIPPLQKGERLRYEVEIESKATEVDAFSEKGSTMGFPVWHWTNEIELTARAPLGWRLELLDPPFMVVDAQSAKPLDAQRAFTPAPKLEGDGSVLEWRVKSPKRGARYVANYRFVRK